MLLNWKRIFVVGVSKLTHYGPLFFETRISSPNLSREGRIQTVLRPVFPEQWKGWAKTFFCTVTRRSNLLRNRPPKVGI